jgi:hypothetical protein
MPANSIGGFFVADEVAMRDTTIAASTITRYVI